MDLTASLVNGQFHFYYEIGPNLLQKQAKKIDKNQIIPAITIFFK